MDLKGGSVDWASKDKSSKKHVIEVREILNNIQSFAFIAFYEASLFTYHFLFRIKIKSINCRPKSLVRLCHIIHLCKHFKELQLLKKLQR